jgi:hypothetical protein
MRKTSPVKTRAKAAPPKRSAADDAHKRIVAAAGIAVRKALKAHKAAGDSVVVWKNGKVVKIPAAKISASR